MRLTVADGRKRDTPRRATVAALLAPSATYIHWLWIPPTHDGKRRTGEHWAIVPPSALRPAVAVEVVGAAPG